jgi:ribosomal protein L28
MTERCVICGKEIIGYGNNAEPVSKGHRRCDCFLINLLLSLEDEPK